MAVWKRSTSRNFGVAVGKAGANWVNTQKRHSWNLSVEECISQRVSLSGTSISALIKIWTFHQTLQWIPRSQHQQWLSLAPRPVSSPGCCRPSTAELSFLCRDNIGVGAPSAGFWFDSFGAGERKPNVRAYVIKRGLFDWPTASSQAAHPPCFDELGRRTSQLCLYDNVAMRWKSQQRWSPLIWCIRAFICIQHKKYIIPQQIIQWLDRNRNRILQWDNVTETVGICNMHEVCALY